MSLVSALDRKLLRDILRLKGQIATIALVLAAGIISFISLRGATLSLESARDAYYDRCLFAHVFARVEHAPESLAREIESLPGVEAAQTRIAKEVTLPLEGMSRPAWGRILSLPDASSPATNAVLVRKGRLPLRGRDDEVVVLESFAQIHGLEPGHRLPAVINGKLRHLRIVGVVVSPEFVYAIRPGAMVDDPKRYAVLWMNRSTLASAFQLEGAFNEVSLRIQPGASDVAIREELDRRLRPYGADGAIDRDHQTSNRILKDELGQLGSIGGLVPIVFLAVAAFLINMVLGRLIALQRTEIAALKAIGYKNREIGLHFLKLVVIVLLPGGVVGVLGGRLLGSIVLDLYASIFRFPDLAFQMTFGLAASAVLASAAAAIAGALLAIRSATRLPPAEAMLPPAPARYRRGLIDRLHLARVIGPSMMMILREIGRHPLRTSLSSLGMAGAIALIILGNFAMDSIDEHFDDVVSREQRQDLSIVFARPISPRAVHELAHTPGVLVAEEIRAVPVRVTLDQRTRDTMLLGIPEDATLRQLMERGHSAKGLPLPPDGILVTNVLAEVLGFSIGDRIDVELREGGRAIVHPVVVGLVDEPVGLQLYARASFVAALERDAGAVSGALVTVDPPKRAAVEERLRRSPQVIDVGDVKDDMARLRAMNRSAMDVWSLMSITLSACVIFGVVYNNARIALATRSRELASLRVLGMSRAEISTILIGGLAIEVLIAIPLGLLFGRVWSQFFMSNIDRESFRWTVFITPKTYALAIIVVLLSGAASALWVRRSLDHLDLIGVLKTRE